MALAMASTTATGSEEQGPTLKLIVEKGPLSGQTFDFRSGSRIQIGRVVRGNSITIKDAGISSKHVVIQYASNSHPDPGPKSCQWTITDLASSNGTILNDAQLEPAESSVLSDGDVVKIGELTSIRVKFEATGRQGEGNIGKTRRNPRRGTAAEGQKVVELAVIDEDSELGIDDRLGDRKNLRGRDRSGKDVVMENEGGELVKNDERKVHGRRTMGSNRALENRSEEMENKMGNAGKVSVSLRRTRRAQKEVNSGAFENGKEEIAEEMEYVGEVKGKGGRNATTRRTRSSKEEEKLEDLDEIRDGPSLMKAVQRGSVRSTRSSIKEEKTGDTGLDLGVTEGRKTRKATRGKKNLPVETAEEEKAVEKMNSKHEMCEGEKAKLEEDGVDGLVKEGTNLGGEGDAGLASASGTKGSSVEVDREEMVDLDTMTLGEWFDYLEVYLPKQIIDATEEMILEMRHKAEKLHEFMSLEKNAKQKDGVAIG
ncbi:FHA domain-containing At4g14490-like [Olea europaea subsp. europaea]|uniref:FHA domain-containing At4g14490-like n=1 Tax=Olea europaea subsp. europaea TaxID=158383 RepID=A0A8S0T3H9_OLEEU|nr:FHA domain-containing At4g14490-like [Olea europaea subsp. europaea]